MESELIHKVFSGTPADFETTALDVFRFQYGNNAIYKKYTDALQVNVSRVDTLCRIPFLPISFFKSHAVTTTDFIPEAVFESSGTSQTVTSCHSIKHLSIYRQSFLTGFKKFYGSPKAWCIIALLPAYLERQQSSLVVMADALIKNSGHPHSGFYLYDHHRLHAVLQELEQQQQQTILIGVTFALLDFAENFRMHLRHTIVMETGGMKGRREEMTRQEVHHLLQERLGVETVHAEYGMTELLSQAYSKGNGIFHCPGQMKVLVRDEDDPLATQDPDNVNGNAPITGILNIIDLANVYSCAFIATDDIGRLYGDGSFEVLGRMDNSDIRGCSLMVL